MDAIDDHMGAPYEEAFRDHLRLIAGSGALGRDDVVAIGSWWRDGGSEIDAVGPAGRSRVPFMVREAKWATQVDAVRLKAKLTAKAVALSERPESLLHVVCARERVDRSDGDTVAATAADIFSA